jgi:predicted lipid-binding transport protein (Tim44 family)
LQGALAALCGRDPTFNRQGFGARVQLVFATLQDAWSSLAWERARPLLTDRLWETQSYWINAYRSAGLRNVTEGARITGLELVRVTSDRWYDAVTVRLRATGLDYTVRVADGAVVGGSRGAQRPYSEYWTLIRGVGRAGPSRADLSCPNCGGPLAVNMAGQCSHCGAKVNSGEFDWVLSRIEQDEAYEG